MPVPILAEALIRAVIFALLLASSDAMFKRDPRDCQVMSSCYSSLVGWFHRGSCVILCAACATAGIAYWNSPCWDSSNEWRVSKWSLPLHAPLSLGHGRNSCVDAGNQNLSRVHELCDAGVICDHPDIIGQKPIRSRKIPAILERQDMKSVMEEEFPDLGNLGDSISKAAQDRGTQCVRQASKFPGNLLGWWMQWEVLIEVGWLRPFRLRGFEVLERQPANQ